MPPFPKPRTRFDYQPAREIQALRQYMATTPGRAIPAKTKNRLLLATWNIANLGVQERRPKDYRLIAEIVSWFDLIAIQEVNDDLSGLFAIHRLLPDRYRLLYSDTGGNRERLAFVYDSTKVDLLDEIGEVAPSPKDYKSIKLRDIAAVFNGFDRSPYLAVFQAGRFVFTLLNVHLFYGSEKKKDVDRRSLEALAVAKWAELRTLSPHAPSPDVIPLGDFNLPKVDTTDPIYRALTRRGLQLPPHSTQIGSTIAGDNHYDQVAFFTDATQANFTGNSGVVDFDGAVFRGLWHATDKAKQKTFRGYVRYYLSDHRPLWAEFRTTRG